MKPYGFTTPEITAKSSPQKSAQPQEKKNTD